MTRALAALRRYWRGMQARVDAALDVAARFANDTAGEEER